MTALRTLTGILSRQAFEHLLASLVLWGDLLRRLGLQQRAGTLEVLSTVAVTQQPEVSNADEATR